MEKDMEQNRKKRRKAIDDIFAMAVIMLLMGAAVMNVVLRKGSTSEKENRELAAFPELSAATLLDGSFMEKFETYASDRFAWRDGAVSVKAQLEKWMGKPENKGVYFAGNDYLISRPEEFDKENTDRNVEAIKTLHDVGGYDMTVAVIPTAYEILRDKLPDFSYDKRVSDVLWETSVKFAGSGIKYCNVEPLLSKHKDEYIYYRTDHHQTALGSYYVYSALGSFMGYTPKPIENYNIETLSDKFYGTTWSKASIFSARPDAIQKFTPKDEECGSAVEFPLENSGMDGLYKTENLAKKDKYTVYLDGNHGLTEIHTDNGTGKRLAVVKDSYAHSIVPFLTQHYEYIYMIDLRYYNDDIVKYFADNDVSEVLVLYNAENFNTDKSLGTLGDMALTTSALLRPAYGELKEQDPVGNEYFVDAVFFGDSLTEAHSTITELPAQFVSRTSVNTMTMDSDSSRGAPLASALLSLQGISKYYLMIGINEIHYMPLEGYIERYGGLIDRIKEQNPDAVIYIQSILPIERRVEGDPVKKETIDAANNMLLDLAREKSCYYLDINSAIAEPDGYLPEGSASDGIHFYGEAHKAWDDFLKNHAVDTGVKNKEIAEYYFYLGDGTADIKGFERDMINSGIFKDTLSAVNDNVTARLTGISEGEALAGILYIGSGSTAEEFGAFEASSPEAAASIAEKLKKHIENRKPSFETYKPGEMPKLNDPVIEVHGNVVMLSVSDDNGRSKEIMDKYR